MAKSPMLEFPTQLKRIISNEIQDIHTALPGEIVEVDAGKGLAKVRPAAKMNFNGEELNYPDIPGVPIVFPYAGDRGMVFPVKEGDDCLIVFSEQATEKWLGLGNTSSTLKHSLSGAVCIPGIMKTPGKDFQTAQKDDSVIIRNGDAQITLTEGGIVLKGDVYVTGHLYASTDEDGESAEDDDTDKGAESDEDGDTDESGEPE
ncbi:MAG: hypothetical protein LUD47_07550 [Clostridia bacterium]|nr:hypothetical protein [Clostridia bacterium]